MTAGIAPSSPRRIDARAAGPLRLSGWRAPAIAAAVFLAAHLAFLAPTLDDIDAVNFAFGVRAFDPAQHHPHPPGYPVYIALGKLSTPLVRAVRPADPLAPIRRDDAALALALWSALCGAVCLLACYAVFLQLEALDPRASDPGKSTGPPAAAWAAILSAVAPLAWFTSSRPMSDVPGLAATLVAQALLLDAWRREERTRGVSGGAVSLRAYALPVGALAAGLALGVRSQVLWLTLPLLVAAVVARGRRLGVRAMVPGVLAYGAGIVAWAIPMMVATGDWRRYLNALGGQGAEDFSGVDMLWTHFGPRRLTVGLWQTFVLPWSSLPLAVVVVMAGLAGVAVMWRRARVPLALVALLAGPYAIFHTLFHETVTTRYALPLVPFVCYLATRGLAAAGRRASAALLAVVTVWSLVVGVPAIRAYSEMPSPIFQALDHLQAEAASGTRDAVLGMHRRISTESRPALAWADLAPWSRRLPSPRGGEWNEALAVLRAEPDRPIWFLGEPARRGELRVRDLALIDPRAVRDVRELDWNFRAAGLLDGVRPGAVDVYVIQAPGWIAGEGWALTPETAGVAEKRGRGLSYGPIDALVRRRADETILLVGGRHLGRAADGAGRVDVQIDGRTVAELVVEAEPRFFLRLLRLPAGTLAGPGPFAALTLKAMNVRDATRSVPIAIEQFDIDGVNGLLQGYDTGWQEEEYDPSRQQSWRWMSERATMVVRAGGIAPLTFRLTAESPRKYFDRASQVTVRIGNQVLARVTPDARLPRLVARAAGSGTFSVTVPIDRAALDRASGRITIETDQFFVPADREQSADRRHLAMRVLDLQVVSASGGF